MQPPPWLPANALDDGVLSTALTACAELWCARWFSDAKTPSLRLAPFRGRIAPSSDSVHYELADAGVTLSASALTHRLMASWMLGLPHGANKAGKSDQALLEALGGRCVANLLEDIARSFGIATTVRATTPPSAEFDGLRGAFSISAASQVFELCVPRAVAVRARKAVAGPPTPPPTPADRIAGLERQSIEVGAMVGLSRLPLSDLASLASGDILLLDRGPGDDATLTINGDAKAGAVCSLFHDGMGLKLRLKQLNGGMQ